MGALSKLAVKAALKDAPYFKTKLPAETVRELAAQLKYGSNPKKLVNKLLVSFGLPEAARTPLNKLAVNVRQIQAERRQLGANKIDPLKLAAMSRSLNLERNRALIKAQARFQGNMNPFWRKDFANNIAGYASYDPHLAEREARRATLESVARAAKKAGYTVTHTSANNGRSSSRYLQKEGKVFRLSDHYLPETAEREYKRSEFGQPKWDEVLVDDWRDRTLDDYLYRLEKGRFPEESGELAEEGIAPLGAGGDLTR